MVKRGRPENSDYEKKRQIESKQRLKILCDKLADRGISQGEIARRINKIHGYESFDRGVISRFKNLSSYSFPREKAQLICEVINKYPNDSIIHAGADFRWQWLAAEDDYETYADEWQAKYKYESCDECPYYNENHAEVVDDE